MAAAISLFAAAQALPAQDFDFSTLDKLGAIAKSATNVTLDANMLKLASGFLDDKKQDDQKIKSLVSNLKGVYVREYEFDKPGQYSESDLAPLREFLRRPEWKTVVDVRDAKENTQICFLPSTKERLGGLAVVSAEPTSLTVVYINGDLDLNDLQKLSGNMGIPDIKLLAGDKSAGGKADKKTTK